MIKWHENGDRPASTLTKREAMAAQIMACLYANSADRLIDAPADRLAPIAVEAADALLQELHRDIEAQAE